MLLLRSLLMVTARFNFTFEAKHIPGRDNHIADVLSRFDWQVFRRLAPESCPEPTVIPISCVGLLQILRSVCFLREGLALSTRKTYLSARRAFANFCQLSSRLQVNGSPYPATE